MRTIVNVQTGEVTQVPDDIIYPDPAPPTAEQRIAELKQLLRDTDYVALSDYDKDKPDVLAQRQAWRDEIRALEQTQVG
jgi:hypothetical protein